MLEVGEENNEITHQASKMRPLIQPVYVQLMRNITKSQWRSLPIRFAGTQDNPSSYKKKEQNLLKFPVLPLEETVQRFLKTAEPLVNAKEKKDTVEEANKFLAGEGPELHKLLENAAKCDKNWLATRWLSYAYLKNRACVPFYSNPGGAFPIRTFASTEEYLTCVARSIAVMVQYKSVVDTDQLPIQKMGDHELDNSQFGLVLGTCRVPKEREDILIYNPKSQHVVVAYKNHFYKLPVYNKNGQPVHPDIILQELCKIVRDEEREGLPFGLLFCEDRDRCADSYEELITIGNNKDSVNEIQRSLVVVALDKNVPYENCTDDIVNGHQLIHGGGAKQNSGNRWFDKTIQLIFNENGMNGFCYEHSPAEGQPVAVMAEYIYKNVDNVKLYANFSMDCISSKKLVLETSPCLNRYIRSARRFMDKMVADFDFDVVHFKGYGKNFIKQQKMSPDSYMQMGFQYAFYMLHGVPGATYESAHLRIYNGGRTETIRSCSNEAVAFAKAMCDLSASDEQRVQLLRKAVDGHRNYTNMALRGCGVDRYLLGLKFMALENNRPLPKLFSTPGFVKSSHFRLSTSQVAYKEKAFMCYGTAVMDGYACCYNPRDKDMIMAISCWRNNPDITTAKLREALIDAFDSMAKTICKVGENVASKL